MLLDGSVERYWQMARQPTMPGLLRPLRPSSRQPAKDRAAGLGSPGPKVSIWVAAERTEPRTTLQYLMMHVATRRSPSGPCAPRTLNCCFGLVCLSGIWDAQRATLWSVARSYNTYNNMGGRRLQLQLSIHSTVDKASIYLFTHTHTNIGKWTSSRACSRAHAPTPTNFFRPLSIIRFAGNLGLHNSSYSVQITTKL